jgi:hypothetical protein
LAEVWKFRLTRQETRSRRLILEGAAFPPYPRPYHDELFLYLVMGADYLSLEVSRDFDGERLTEYFIEALGAPEDTRIQVGGRQDEEEGALLLSEWHFPPEARPEMMQRLGDIIGQALQT